MAAGRPVIGSDVPGLREIVDDGSTGILVPPQDEVSLADAICRLLSSPVMARSMGVKGYERARRLFSADLYRKNWVEAYRTLVTGGS